MAERWTLISNIQHAKKVHPAATEHQKAVMRVAGLLGLSNGELVVERGQRDVTYRLGGVILGQPKTGYGTTPGRALAHLCEKVGISRKALAEAWQEVNW